jgi:hypothetical protein
LEGSANFSVFSFAITVNFVSAILINPHAQVGHNE